MKEIEIEVFEDVYEYWWSCFIEGVKFSLPPQGEGVCAGGWWVLVLRGDVELGCVMV